MAGRAVGRVRGGDVLAAVFQQVVDPCTVDGSQTIDKPLCLLLRQCAHESFFHTLKVELVHQRRWATSEDARRDLSAYIEGYYNRRRLHFALGYRTPEQAEGQMA